jgi:hypothetical protein
MDTREANVEQEESMSGYELSMSGHERSMNEPGSRVSGPTLSASGRGHWARLHRGLCGAALMALLTLPALTLPVAAAAASPPKAALPTASTGVAQQVSYGSATLAGSLNPKGSDTSYYFQYGLTKAYGGQTAIADAGAGTQALGVSLPVTGLQPLSVYHYRLVAVNVAGATIGVDRTLLTTKIPLALAILSSPDPVSYGGMVTVQGTLSGTGNGGREVVLQANLFPFTAGFVNVGNPEVTLASGSFSFLVPGLAQVTQFRVVTTTNPPVISPVALENVAVQVASHVARSRRPHFARIFGTVTPAEDGMEVGILRITHGHGVLVGGTVLRHLDAARSSFSRVVPVRRGVYRVLVRVTNGAQVSGYGSPLTIG